MFFDNSLVALHEGVLLVPVIVHYTELAVFPENPRKLSSRRLAVKPVDSLSYGNEADAGVSWSCILGLASYVHKVRKLVEGLFGIQNRPGLYPVWSLVILNIPRPPPLPTFVCCSFS